MDHPRPSPELSDSLDRLGAGWIAVHGPLDEGSPELLAARVWDVEALGMPMPTSWTG